MVKSVAMSPSPDAVRDRRRPAAMDASRRVGRFRTGLALLIVLTTGLVLLVTAPPAAAHGAGGDDATSYRSVITSAGEPCLDWSILGGDAQVQLDNRCHAVVTILGYEGEPYLRFSPGRVEENQRSPARWLNQDRYSTQPPPADASADANPDWQTVADGSRFAWHDHRIHWMAPSRPSQVSTDGGEQRVFDWSLQYQTSSTQETQSLEGTLWWSPSPPWWLPLAVVLAAAAVLLAACATVARTRGQRWWELASRPLAVVLLAFTLAVAARGVDDLLTVSASSGTVAVAAITLTAVVALLAILARRAWRADAGAFGALALSGLATLWFVGAPNKGQLGAPYLLSSLPGWFARTVTAVGLVWWVPVLVVAVAAERHHGNFFGRGIRRAPRTAE